MENLAGVLRCGPIIKKELKKAGVLKFRRIGPKKRRKCEVPSPVMGLLIKNGKIVFRLERGWYYWIVEGDVPLDVARILYTGVGKKEVRVAGHCGCPPPEDWAIPKSDDLLRLGIYENPSKDFPYGKSPTYGEIVEMCNKGEINAPRYVSVYHIDSQEGLNFFVRIIKACGLIDRD